MKFMKLFKRCLNLLNPYYHPSAETKKNDDINLEIKNSNNPENDNNNETNHLIQQNLTDYHDIKWEDTIPFIPPIESGVVIKVYDGDTITIASRLPYIGSPLYRFSVRLNGIDAPEMKSKDDDERCAAKKVQQELSARILNKNIILKNVQLEKYGRVLAELYTEDGTNINDWLLEKGYVVKYDGGTKNTYSNWCNKITINDENIIV